LAEELLLPSQDELIADEEEDEEDPDEFLPPVSPHDRWVAQRAEKREAERKQEARKLHARKAAAVRWKRQEELEAELEREERERKRIEREPFRDVDKAVLCILVWGEHMTQLSRSFRWMRADFPSVRSIQRRMSTVCAEIVDFGKRKLDAVYQAMPMGSVAALDGAWAHPRHSGQHTMSVVSAFAGRPQVVHLVVKERDQGGAKKPQTFKGNHDGPPATMETSAIQEFARLEAKRPGGSRIGVLVTDGQNSVQQVCAGAGWNPEHVLDPGHLVRCVERRITAHLGYVPPGLSRRRLVLADLRPFLVHWFRKCGKGKLPLEKKQAMWKGALAHYTAEDSKWRHKADPRARDLLSKLLEEVAPMLAKYQDEWNTQACEAYNALRSRLEDKNTSWKITHEPRSFVAALNFNFGWDWVAEFCEETQIELDEDLIHWVWGESGKIKTRRAMQRTPEYRAAKCAARLERKTQQRAKASATDVTHEDETRIEDDPLATRDRVGAVRDATKPASSRLFGEDVVITQLITFDNPFGRFCHMDAPLELLMAMPELSAQIVSECDASTALSALITRVATADSDATLDTDDFRAYLVQADLRFQSGGATLPDGTVGDWFTAWQPPAETFTYILDDFRSVAFDLGKGSPTSLGELFAFTVARQYAAADGRRGCAPVDPVEYVRWAMLSATGGDVPLTDARNGDWLANLVTRGRASGSKMCLKCGIEHEFSRRGGFVSLGEYFAIDYNNCVRGPGVNKHLPVHVPLDLDIPLIDGTRPRYTMFGFVELKDGHAVAFVRISPTHFVRYDDCKGISWAVIPTSAVQVRAYVSVAIYRSTN
jgi:hypothetical protein